MMTYLEFNAPKGCRFLVQIIGRTIQEAQADVMRIFGPARAMKAIYAPGAWRGSNNGRNTWKWHFDPEGGWMVFVRK